ncbi:G-type lectin S-receptor-like serine/threonine-protein kinase At1g34300 [Apium graveolens]|uniref:G-type lectin S-receptor-like serine/threonine-protein kinase At1g34300 n=1 Tax=Apium graveolens TaxID=4045 RepID=UPI003D79DCCA
MVMALLWEHNVTYWRSYLGSSVAVKEARFDGDGVLGVFDDANKIVWSTSSKDFRDPFVKLRHLRIDQDGNLRIVCGFNSSGPVCDCLFSDSNEWAAGASATDFGNSGCKKMIDLSNCKMHTSMLNDGSSLCTVKRTSLISGYQTPSVPSTSYLKACFVPQPVLARGVNPHGDAGSLSLSPGKFGAERGFCFETKHKIMLFEYIPNGSLDNILFNVDHDKGNSDWQQRLDFAIGIARDLAYLHSECQQSIIHGNLKLENVLLDEKLAPKLTNFESYEIYVILSPKRAKRNDT